MKDVAALCRRVVIIAHGQIQYDGSLAGILDEFSGHKVVTLQFAEGQLPTDLSALGEVLEVLPPRAKLQVDREDVARVLSTILNDYVIEDVSVEEPPLEQVIAAVFSKIDTDAARDGQVDAAVAAGEP
jgi:ABC-2 type transport system ATP-binding protein